MPGAEKEEFEVGDLIKLSDLGKIKVRSGVNRGKVMSVISAMRVSVLFDGRKTRVTIFRSYITRA